MRIGIFGSNGYLGSNISKQFSFSKNIEVFNFDIHAKSKYELNNYQRIDITKKADFTKITQNLDFIFLFSAITGSLQSFDNSENMFRVNILGLINVLDFIKGKNTTLVFPSTRLVYKGKEDLYIDEDSEKYPLTPYAISKFSGEQLIMSYSRLFKIKYYIFRISVPYGNLIKSDYSYGTIGIMINQIINENKITLFGDGTQKRTFTNLIDIFDIFENTLLKKIKSNNIYNIGGESLSLKEVANLFEKKFNIPVFHKSWPESYNLIESGSTSFLSQKIDNLIGKKKYLKLSNFIMEELEIKIT